MIKGYNGILDYTKRIFVEIFVRFSTEFHERFSERYQRVSTR